MNKKTYSKPMTEVTSVELDGPLAATSGNHWCDTHDRWEKDGSHGIGGVEQPNNESPLKANSPWDEDDEL